jgi:hypothetical protein
MSLYVIHIELLTRRENPNVNSELWMAEMRQHKLNNPRSVLLCCGMLKCGRLLYLGAGNKWEISVVFTLLTYTALKKSL